MKTKQQELIDLLDEVSNPDVIIISSGLKSVATKLLKSINSNSAGERRAIGSNEQTEEVCIWCQGSGKNKIWIDGKEGYCPCWNCKQTD